MRKLEEMMIKCNLNYFSSVNFRILAYESHQIGRLDFLVMSYNFLDKAC